MYFLIVFQPEIGIFIRVAGILNPLMIWGSCTVILLRCDKSYHCIWNTFVFFKFFVGFVQKELAIVCNTMFYFRVFCKEMIPLIVIDSKFRGLQYIFYTRIVDIYMYIYTCKCIYKIPIGLTICYSFKDQSH